MSSFHECMKSVRIQKHLTQSDVAKGSGLALRSLKYYEAGERVPDVNALRKLSLYFQVSADWLLGISDDKTIHSPIPPEGDTLPPDTDH